MKRRVDARAMPLCKAVNLTVEAAVSAGLDRFANKGAVRATCLKFAPEKWCERRGCVYAELNNEVSWAPSKLCAHKLNKSILEQ